MTASTKRSLGLLMASCALWACNQSHSGVDPDKRVNELDASELRAVCESTLEDFGDLIASQSDALTTCTLAGLFTADSPEGCVEMRDACVEREMADPSEPSPSDEINCDTALPPPDTCDITVGELERCYDDTLAELDARMDLYDCANAGDERVRDLLLDSTPPPSCAPYVEACTTGDMPPVDGTPEG